MMGLADGERSGTGRSGRRAKLRAKAKGKEGRLDERLSDAACDGGVIARIGPARGVHPGSAVDPCEVDGVAGARGMLLL